MAKKKDPDLMRISVVVDVTVSRSAWLEKYGDFLHSHQMVPEVLLEKAVRKGIREKIEELQIPKTEVR